MSWLVPNKPLYVTPALLDMLATLMQGTQVKGYSGDHLTQRFSVKGTLKIWHFFHYFNFKSKESSLEY